MKSETLKIDNNSFSGGGGRLRYRQGIRRAKVASGRRMHAIDIYSNLTVAAKDFETVSRKT